MRIFVLWIVWSVCFTQLALAASGQREIKVTKGVLRGNVVRILKTDNAEGWNAPKRTKPAHALETRGQDERSQVQLALLAHDLAATGAGGHRAFRCFEVRVTSLGRGEWSCWIPDFPTPHRFEITSTLNGKRYVSFVGRGVQILRLEEPRDSGDMLQCFLDNLGELGHPDALPLLDLETIAFKGENISGVGPQAWNISVVSLDDSHGGVEVTVRGAETYPQRRFRLTNDGWKLKSTLDGKTKD